VIDDCIGNWWRPNFEPPQVSTYVGFYFVNTAYSSKSLQGATWAFGVPAA